MSTRSDVRKRIEDEASPTDWRGKPVRVSDHVVFPYGWGGVPIAMCEGVVLEIEKSLDSSYLLKVDLHYDNGAYPRKRPWVWVKNDRVTKVAAR